jgi:hypothetical protein
LKEIAINKIGGVITFFNFAMKQPDNSSTHQENFKQREQFA